ncbi:hypothetical protein KDJ21_016525 [Metabacillus litoralis]|uniref:hypothetical protein n=1 Tax=Metabacillus TaxID=2675233 RepID=UPI000EF5DEBC|nr:hypothetical protein [Metabacillus litoralis]MCM3163952.1 hypothetical protein [Metabacillus litoralis]MCM3410448.1 hypothetical protein [Metabacillus litoralis]UHA58455.1 hypothetical protein KDJ21_016525 [Metabacillus litoralis]
MNKIEAIFWSVALPGLGQLLNKKYIKGITLVALEIIINVQANFNTIIINSFHGEIEKAIYNTNYQWLMFYPCLYFFSIWDAYKDAAGEQGKYSFLPFVFAGYFVTVGLIYSSKFKIFGIIFGPVWLPILAVIPGLIVGFLLKRLLR